jgi:hypothetical protein
VIRGRSVQKKKACATQEQHKEAPTGLLALRVVAGCYSGGSSEVILKYVGVLECVLQVGIMLKRAGRHTSIARTPARLRVDMHTATDAFTPARKIRIPTSSRSRSDPPFSGTAGSSSYEPSCSLPPPTTGACAAEADGVTTRTSMSAPLSRSQLLGPMAGEGSDKEGGAAVGVDSKHAVDVGSAAARPCQGFHGVGICFVCMPVFGYLYASCCKQARDVGASSTGYVASSTGYVVVH